MAIRIVDDACVVTGNQGTVIVEGSDPEVVSGTAAKNEVLTKATALGLSRAGISGQGGAYPVDGDGKELDNLAGTDVDDVRYRNDYQVTSGL